MIHMSRVPLFKIITASACLEERVVSLSDTFSCPLPDRGRPENPVSQSRGGHGAETFVQRDTEFLQSGIY